MMLPEIVCWGELLWDLFPDGPRLGGGAANVAYHLARLGNRPALVSRVGDDELGHAAIAALKSAGVDTEHVQIDPEHKTGTVKVELDQGEPRFSLAERAAWDRIEWNERMLRAISGARALCYGTLAQRTPLGLGALSSALAAAPPSVTRICDLNVRLPHTTNAAVDAALSGVQLVKLNEHEARVLRELYGVDDAVRWLLEERRVELVALTLGARGVELHARGRKVHEPGVPTQGGDRVGAGDAFTAALAHLWMRAASLDRIAERANRYAAFVASSEGAMPLIPDELARSTVP